MPCRQLFPDGHSLLDAHGWNVPGPEHVDAHAISMVVVDLNAPQQIWPPVQSLALPHVAAMPWQAPSAVHVLTPRKSWQQTCPAAQTPAPQG
jgi:hypothetical protein